MSNKIVSVIYPMSSKNVFEKNNCRLGSVEFFELGGIGIIFKKLRITYLGYITRPTRRIAGAPVLPTLIKPRLDVA
jgi:hypothetical protein